MSEDPHLRRITAPPSELGVRASWRVVRRALGRLWGRDVMLYTGGVSFFALLAFFPALTILVGLYGAFSTPEMAAKQAAGLAFLLPYDAQALFTDELMRLSTTSKGAISLQNGFALVVGLYAAHRGFKALLAGLSFIHEEDKPHGFVRFNIMAAVVAAAAFALVAFLSFAIIVVRIATTALNLPPLGASLFSNEWTWAAGGLTVGLTFLYRYAMSSDLVGWRASAIAGAAAAFLSLAASLASAVYVGQIAHLGATYGSIGAVVVFLVWLSWNVNAVFLGGALATETEIALKALDLEWAAQERGRGGAPRTASPRPAATPPAPPAR